MQQGQPGRRAGARGGGGGASGRAWGRLGWGAAGRAAQRGAQGRLGARLGMPGRETVDLGSRIVRVDPLQVSGRTIPGGAGC